jgi:hypothetical protein
MRFDLDGRQLDVELEGIVIAGFTGRNREAAAEHLDELAQDGIPVPSTIPTFYLVPHYLGTQDQEIVVTHARTSGEAEVVLIVTPSQTYITLGSDHTDRLAETKDIALSKLVCPKVLADEVWPITEVTDHWDELELRSWIVDGHETLYQEGTTGSLLRPDDLLDQVPLAGQPEAYAIFAGTLPARGGIRGHSRFRAELRDPRRDRAITLEYQVRQLALLDSSESTDR